MPHALTERQNEFLGFIKDYIRENEDSPSLNEIAEHFGVKPATAHNMLKALQHKDYIFFMRHPEGFFIRLVERGGMSEQIFPLNIVGTIDQYGEVIDFPEYTGYFPAILPGASPDTVSALVVTKRITEARMQVNDLLIFDLDKKPQPGDIFIGPIGQRLFLLRVYSKTLDKYRLTFEVALDYPIPEALSYPEEEQRLHWYPLAYGEETEEYILDVMVVMVAIMLL